MEVHISLDGRGDIGARIYRQLLDAILDGRLRPGERLPATRDLALRLDVARNTVAAAYERLTAEGFLVGRVGSGTFVSEEPVGQAQAPGAPHGGVQPRAVWQSIALPPRAGPADAAYDFRAGVPDARLFPLAAWRRLAGRELRTAVVAGGDYAEPAGHAGLRAAIARHIGISRSVRAGPADVVVTHGAQQALDLVGRVAIEPGACVAVEEPGYPPARLLFRSLGGRVAGVPVDAEGLVVAAIPESARLVYVTPSHQFPLGVPMSLRRRAALLDWAERHDALVVEDDYDSEYRFAGRPLEPLQCLDRGGRVVYVGSFSKTLLPMLRVGFLVAPRSLLPALGAAKQLADWHGEPATQAALARFIDEGLLAAHVRRATREYAARRQLVLAALAGELAAWLEPVPAAAGLHVCARLRPGVDANMERVTARLAERGVAMEALARYCGEAPAHAGLLIGYGAIARDRVGDGLRHLAECLRAEG